jgi:predicted dehydrogenase
MAIDAQPTVSLGLAGSGSSCLGYARALAQVDGVRVRVAAAQPALALELAKTVPGIKLGNDAFALATSHDVEAVVFADPLREPFSLVRKALLHDKHVLISGIAPFVSSQQMRELARLAMRRSRVLIVAEERLFHPALVFLGRMLSEKSGFWRFRYLRSLVAPAGAGQASTAALTLEQMALAAHMVESHPERVNASACYGDSPIEPVAVFVTMHYPEGRVVSLQVSALEVQETRQWALVTDSKTVLVDECDPRAPLRIVSAGSASASGNLLHLNPPVPLGDWPSESTVTPPVTPVDARTEQCRHFVSVASRNDASQGNAGFWAEVISTWEGVQESMALAGAPVEVRPEAAKAAGIGRPRLRIIHGRGTGGAVRRGKPSLTLVSR